MATKLEEKLQIIELNKQGLTNKQISVEMHKSPTTIRKVLNEYNLEFNSDRIKMINKKEITYNAEQIEVLLGSLLGDMCLTKETVNARCAISHGGNQELYFDHKCSLFPNLLGKICKTPRYDKRTEKYYNKYSVRMLAHPNLTALYNELYINGVKTITVNYLNKLTERSLAYWFMDDGAKHGVLATMCFSDSELQLIQELFLNKFNIRTRINNQKCICIVVDDLLQFEKLIFPYLIPEMYYKLHKLDPNSVNCGKLLRDSNTNS